MIRRMLRAAAMNGQVYRELRDDPTATVQALGVVLLGSLAIALAGVLGYVREEGIGVYTLVLIRSLSAAIAGWIIASLVPYLIGGRVLRRSVTFTSILRIIGFANDA